MTVAVPLTLLVVLGALVVLLLAIVWSLKHHRDVRFEVRPEAPLVDLLPSIAGLTHGTVVEGNAVEVLQDAAYFDALLADVREARRSIHFETFLWKEGAIGNRLAEALAARARADVRVRVLVDANGSRGMGGRAERLLEEAGCTLVKYHPGRLRTLGRLNNRDHRKLAVFDGRVGYVGGHCVVDAWAGEAEGQPTYRDLSARIRGPVVHDLQSTFSENWVTATGELFVGADVFPELEAEGDVGVHVARLAPMGSASAVKILHHLVLCCARRRIWIQNPYFLPDPEAIRFLTDAVRRGVDVRVMVPSAKASDMPIVQHAAHHNFGKLLAGGVRLFEYGRTLLHQKVMTVDGAWCAIGSSNFDDRSFEINDEVTLGFRDAALAEKLEAIFLEDAEHCVERRLEEWQRRGLGHRLKDGVLYLFNEQL